MHGRNRMAANRLRFFRAIGGLPNRTYFCFAITMLENFL
jgi:hypothetical protein